jgi:hypothetical protein
LRDIWHDWGSDLAIGPGGDLAIAEEPDRTRLRILRRLLTNAGNYIWQPGYGAGLGLFVGKPVVAEEIGSVIRTQMFNEPTVSRSPEPEIRLTVADELGGTVAVQVKYDELGSGTAQVLKFNTSGRVS